MDERKRILAIDDEPDNIDLVERCLATHEVRGFSDPTEGLTCAKDWKPHAIVIDYRMPKMTGVEVLRGCRDAGLKCGALMVTAFPDLDEVLLAEQANLVYRIVAKPYSPETLRSHVRLVLAEAKLQTVLDEGGVVELGDGRDMSSSARISQRIPVDGMAEVDAGDGPQKIRLANVSLGGLGLAECSLAQGKAVQILSVTLARRRFELGAPGRVVWRRDDAGASWVGVSFSANTVDWERIAPIMRQAYVNVMASWSD